MDYQTLDIEELEKYRVEINPSQIKEFKYEGQFMSISLELFKEVSTYLLLITQIPVLDNNGNPRGWTRNEAILGGLMVRISKLQSAFMDQICQRRFEIALILQRCIFESIINVHYLIKGKKDELFNEYIEASLVDKKKLYDEIEQNIKTRGNEQPIEERMKDSILKAFKESSYSIDDIDSDSKNTLSESVWKRAKAVDMQTLYFPFFGITSNNVHGGWADLIKHHLEKKNDYYFPKREWSIPRPHPLFGLSFLSALVTNEYLLSHFSYYYKNVQQLLSPILVNFITRVKAVDKLHEEFVQCKYKEEKIAASKK